MILCKVVLWWQMTDPEGRSGRKFLTLHVRKIYMEDVFTWKMYLLMT